MTTSPIGIESRQQEDKTMMIKSQSPCSLRRSVRQRRRRRQHLLAFGGLAAVWTGLIASSLTETGAVIVHQSDSSEPRQRHLRFPRPSGRSLGTAHQSNRSMKTCLPNQHTFVLTMYTDSHSISDNSWRISHAAGGAGAAESSPEGNSASTSTSTSSGLEIHRESVGSGNLGYGAVVIDTICADKAGGANQVVSPSPSFIESCYDIELFDANGDGLTSSWGGGDGLSGGFALSLDGINILEHRSKACPFTDSPEWNKCALTNGFEYCGLRVCTTTHGARVSGSATISNLSGSECSVSQPQCQSNASSSSSSSSVLVQVDTDSFADELSWELRASSKSDPTSMKRAFDNELLLAGGQPFYQETQLSSNIMLGQPGVGFPLSDRASYSSSACLSDDQSVKCYDLRAYDVYGDGLGCGADGSLSIELETAVSADLREKLTVTQRDGNMAKRQEVDGKKKLACMDESGLSKWHYCAVRVCMDGTVIALEGNQCDFGMGEDLIDSRFLDIDPLSGLKMRPRQDEIPQQEEVVKLEDAMPEKDVESIEEDELSFDITEEFVVKDMAKVQRDEDVDETWAEYYEALEPGLRGDPQAAFAQPNQDEPNQEEKRETPTVLHGVKGPRNNKDGSRGQTNNERESDEDNSKVLTRIQRMKKKKQRERQQNLSNKDESDPELNVMGYVSNSQRKNERRKTNDDDEYLYEIEDGDNFVYVDEGDDR